ncbi:uroporphyrinogen decarboxylase [Terrilactibacillus sp. BCM23-1]|uniref:Uroporphyrinogen decarboxylase n=1 Tax=Terrilactibacillus tamarindi TaxID=2599694 RepID=A0A6N8CQX3_9BACI|nr:uroporphyrinogen decarboxylase family protein [Terrilactibacillus tamarindi]MTT32639.1 uroporphyrinogen decarboxylase [Terrilactibacillus tamarindi]
MAENKHQILLDTLDNKPTDRVLAGFWHHYLSDEQKQVLGYRDLAVIDEVVKRQQNFYDRYDPDFTKIMSDGFFLHPSVIDNEFETPEDLKKIKPIDPDDPWITRQVAAVKAIVDHYEGEIGSFYNIFSPWYQLRLRFEIFEKDTEKIYRFLKEGPQAIADVLDVLSDDLIVLSTKLMNESGIDGIYLCVQQPQDADISTKHWQQYVQPSEVKLLRAVQDVHDYNIIHICGFEGKRNRLGDYKDYPVKAFHWATYVEGVSLKEGKKLFDGRTVMGGFENTVNGVFYKGTKEEIQAETQRLLEENGRQGILLSGDCSIPFDTDDAHAQWVSEMLTVSACQWVTGGEKR